MILSKRFTTLTAAILAAVPVFLTGTEIKVPAGTTSVRVNFQANKEPIPLEYIWADGTKKKITVQPGDFRICWDSNSGASCDLPQAGFEFVNLNKIKDFVRPNASLYRYYHRKEVTDHYKELPEIYGKAYMLEIRGIPDGSEFYLNGNFAGNGGKGVPQSVVTTLPETAFSFGKETYDPKYQKLDVTRLDHPGRFKNAKVRFDGAGEIPFMAPTGINLDLGETAKQKALYPNDYGDSGYTGRNAFDHAEASYLFTVPMKQYANAWILCAADFDTSRTRTFTVRITRYVPSGAMGGRAYSALGDTMIDFDKVEKKQVGTVEADGITLPLWMVKAPINTGKIIDLITDYPEEYGRGAFSMHYLDFELLGETPDKRTAFDDPRVWPDPKKPSAIHVFGVTLERSGVNVHFKETTISRNVFDDTMKPEMKVSYQRVFPGDYTLDWRIYDHNDREISRGSVKLEGESGEKTIDLAQKKLGWYGIDYTVRQNGKDLLTHKASFALLGKDTRRAGYDSPYIGWSFGTAHYKSALTWEAMGLEFKLFGIHRVTGLINSPGMHNISLEKFDKFKVCDILVCGGQPGRGSDGTVESWRQRVTDFLKKSPHTDMCTLFWESSGPYSPYVQAPELFDEPVPEPTPAWKAEADRRWKITMHCYEILKEFPQVRIALGNTLCCTELIAETLRRKPPKDMNLVIGSEAIQRNAHPEKPFINYTMMYSRQMMDVAKKLGYDLKVTCGPENISRTQVLGDNRLAEWLVRDMLVQHAFGFKDIAGAGRGTGVGNSYANSFYNPADNRDPYAYPPRRATATATLTKVLDCVEFQKFIPTGSKTVYCMEFTRSYDKKKIYVVWASRGQAELTIKTGTPEVEMVEFHGNPSIVKTPDRILKLTASSAAQYIIADAPVESATVGKRTYDPPEKEFAVINPLDNGNVTWTNDTEKVNAIEQVKAAHRILAKKATAKKVEDPEKGTCLELSIDSDKTLNNQYFEYMVIRPSSPILIKNEASAVGMWVKGNSGWGEIFWELEDAKGIRRISCSSIYWGGNNYDFEGLRSLDYDGWCFLSMPVVQNSIIPYISTNDVEDAWTERGVPAFPCKVVGIYFCAPVSPQYIHEYGTCDQTIRIKDLSAISIDPLKK